MPQPNQTYEFDALGTHWWVEPLNKYKIDGELRCKISDVVKKFDDDYSRFVKTSLISKLNNEKTLINPPAEMLQMMKYAKKTFSDTEGIFNISVGGLLSKFGYGSVDQSADVDNDIWINSTVNNKRIKIPKSATIDFGGFGKGWLIDKISDLLIDNNIGEYIVNGGGDIYVNSNVAIELGLEHPYDQSKVIGTTKITKGALAVSSIVKRRWNTGQQFQHHIIDPATQQSSNNDIVASYIKAEAALIADTMATCLIIKPELQNHLTKMFDLKVILLTKNQILESE